MQKENISLLRPTDELSIQGKVITENNGAIYLWFLEY